MLRGYRCIVLTVVGWLILGASPPQDTGERKQAQTEREIANSLKRIAASLQNSAEAEVANEPCEKGGEAAKSDLCAQWKAAQAAESGASAAWLFGMLGCLIGGATLIAAIKAAQFAKQAADHTEAGAKAAQESVTETRRIGEAQVRAYLSIDSIEAERRDAELILTVTAVNSGQSPATIRTVSYRVMTQLDRWQTRVLSRPETISAQGKKRLSPCYIPADREDCESVVIGIRMKVVDVFNHQRTLKFSFAGPSEWGDDDKSDRFSPGEHVAAAIDRMTERGQGAFSWPEDDDGEERA